MASVVAIRSDPLASPAPGPDPVAAERRALAAAIDALGSAVAEMTTALVPIRRLEAVVRATTAAEDKLAACRHADEERLTEWLLAGAIEPRPAVSDETLAAERDVANTARDAAAAKAALPNLERVYIDATNRVPQLQAVRDEAVIAAARAIARHRTAALSDLTRAALEAHASVKSIADALSNPRRRAAAGPV